MSKLLVCRSPSALSILLLPIVLITGMSVVTPLHAQSAVRSDTATVVEQRRDAAQRKRPAAQPCSPFTYDELGATPAVKLPGKSAPGKTPKAPTPRETMASTAERKPNP